MVAQDFVRDAFRVVISPLHVQTYRKFTHLLPSFIHYTNANTLGCFDINYFLIPQAMPTYIIHVGMWLYPACLVPG